MRNRSSRTKGKLALGALLGSGLLLLGLPSFNKLSLAEDRKLANAASEEAQISQIYTVSPTVIAIEVAAPEVVLAQQVPYQEKLGDAIVENPRSVQIRRFGRKLGLLAGEDRDTLYGYDRIQGAEIDEAAADLPESYHVTLADQPESSLAIASAYRKTKPSAFANSQQGYAWPKTHTLFLSLGEPMQPGKTYEVSFLELDLPDTQFAYDPMQTRSEAVHVSQLGFRPDDLHKVGYLSTWMGDGGSFDYSDNLKFWLVDVSTERSVYEGNSDYVRGESQSEDLKGRDYTLSEVHRLDFSSFDAPGDYRLCVQGVGCSFDFKISEGVWHSAFETAIKGFYHQRSGIEIGEPFSQYQRPRAFHPDDGVEVYQAGVSLLEVDMGVGDRNAFEALSATRTDEIVPDAWGGYFDAADWDRRIQHLAVPRALFELHSLFPDHFDPVTLNIPESDNALPDVLDEALWSLDFFRRLQTPEGGIRGGIESAEHPKEGETSWQESLTVMAYAPDMWSSYLYAGVAARAAYTLKDYDTALAATYEESALRAIAFAEEEYAQTQNVQELPHQVRDQRNLAALELYRLTGESRWHDIFLATAIFRDGPAPLSAYDKQEQRDAAFLYVRLSNDPGSANLAVDSAVQRYALESFVQYADSLMDLTRSTAFGWSKDHPYAPVGWGNGLGAPKSVNLFQAHILTGDPKYLEAGTSAAQFSAGANPDNLVFTTGLGERSPQNPMIADYRITGQTPPPGITLYGPADFTLYRDDWSFNLFANEAFPPAHEWPTVESYFDVYQHPIAAEFTVDHMVDAAYTWGYLAAR